MWRLALLFAVWPILALAEDARYQISVELNWTGGEGHPDDRHWSRLIAFAHSGRYSLFADGDTASSGLALVATNGRVSVLEAELDEGRRRGRVGAHVVQPGLPEGTGRFEVELTLTDKHNRVSFATMLAPSPDWFTGASGVSLRNGDDWIAEVTIPLWVWDAGADSGPDFEGPNVDTQPRQSVRLLTHPAFLKPEGLIPIGQAVIQRLP